VAWDRYDPSPVGHYNVFPLTRYPEAGLLQGTNGVLVIDARDPGHTPRDFDFTYNSAFQ
jgi:hypothetical protein